MKAIIYGIGKRFFSLFDTQQFIKIGIESNEIQIIGFADKCNSIGKEIIYRGEKFEVKKINEFNQKDFDKVIITTKKYFEEIRNELIEEGIEKDQIILADRLYEYYFDKMYCIEKFKGKLGVEIGGPSYLFFNIYDKCRACDGVNYCSHTVWWENETCDFRFNNKILGDIIIAEATDMHLIEGEKYDFVLSSNNLEHIANPLKALKEFSRLVKVGGIVLVVVPRKEKMFDHNRSHTAFEHILDDYYNNTNEDDLSHLPEIIEKHDYDLDSACGGKEKFIERAKKNIENRCLHHHVFDEECLRKSFEFVGLEVIRFSELLDNWLIMGKRRI